ncbi:DUF4142 domain-containing protein [Spirosoma montaniterrae]|uniref:DUF4142 domain-containing protein n=1 Tax=Spirosoma montaniterrae TaxID=1178516 RepID=A0A1P9WRL9_9BACT|nr:DUF4142 domain-containing protein [Spirosoma montaniterrae]AQG78025.1 hypothetical protein AWR27_00860 [Spirosoma montaniterrae]
MKTSTAGTLLLAACLLTACGNDAKDKAQEQNEARIDKQATAMSDDAKKEAKQVAGYMVDLFSMGLTEYELSKIALQKATNPEVRSYAQQAMNAHQQSEKSLRDAARQLNVTLPAGLSDDGEDRVSELQNTKAGTAFDIQYLKEMGTVNNKTIDLAKDLRDDAPTDQVRDIAKKILADDNTHKDRAKQLKNVLE